MEGASHWPASPSEQPRSRKRAKYTQLACNECKRRKLKCDGGPTCSRCVRQDAQCIYTPNRHATSNTPAPSLDKPERDDGVSTRFETVDRRIEALQREMQAMSARMRELESLAGTPGQGNNYSSASASSASASANAGLQRIMNRPLSPDYVGPTSAEFGITARQERPDDTDGDDDSSPAAVSDVEAIASDPLGCLGKAEALRLVTVYEDNVGLMYPCIDLDSVRNYVIESYKDETGPGLRLPEMNDQDWFFARDAEVLKIILATALLVESHGRSERAAVLADSVEDRFATRLKIPEVDMKEILILTLLSIFHSYRDDEVIAWRLVGMAIRGSLQLGLHRQETWLRTGGVFPGELQWTWASRLFWCIYVLDRKWSFGTGLPFAIQDSDMDTNLPEPGAATPYLTCMINYARLSTKTWGLVMGWPSRPRAATSDYCSYLDFQVQQWIQSIPRELRFELSTERESPAQTDGMMMLQVLLALQANQLRILVYRQNLLSNESIESNASGASTAVETAKSTVRILDYFSQVSDIYFQRPEPFNYFLISALAALFLAVLHAPSRFSQVCRPEFYAAVDMVRCSSTRARTSRRLQKIIKSLKLIRLNLDSQSLRRHRQQKQKENQTQTLKHWTEENTPSINSRSGEDGITPISTVSPSGPLHHHHRQQVSGLPTPQLSASLLSASSPVTTAPADQNSCEDLTSFFEMAGGLYFDPRADTGAGNDALFLQIGQDDGLNAFQGEDEALTRLMAGLL